MVKRLVYPNLLVSPERYDILYKASSNGPKKVYPPQVRQRLRHATALRTSIERVYRSQQANRFDPDSTRGIGFHLTANASSDVGVDVDSFQGSGAIAEILSIKGTGKSQQANIFVKPDSYDKLIDRLIAYSQYKEEDEGRRPFSFWFFESASEIGATGPADLWMDRPEIFPSDGELAEWEIWVRPESATLIRDFASRFRLHVEFGQVNFPNISILRIKARLEDVARIVHETGSIVELRTCSSLTLQVLNLPPGQQKDLTQELIAKIKPPDLEAPRICILDSGVDHTHPLLKDALLPTRCFTLNGAWDTNGWNEHGTRVAGIALYGDIRQVMARRNPEKLLNTLESVTILRPSGGPPAIGEASGSVASAVALVETQEASRTFCLAIADYQGLNDGSPVTLSGSVDQLAWGTNASPRLFVVAAGNMQDDPVAATGYSARNEQEGIASPGQSFNALTVGGCTFVGDHPHGGQLLCAPGDLSPTTRTARRWRLRKSTKPDVVFEAGNHGIDGTPDGATSPLSELGVLTTNKGRFRYATLFETSAATAAVAGIAGRLSAEYPEYWPETIRALVVHSTNWTPSMRKRVAKLPRKGRVEAMLGLYGWGVPDEQFARRSGSDLLTFVIQDEMLPFRLEGTAARMGDIAYYELPWPETVLSDLGSTNVELRVTLSYFVEPDMRAVSAGNVGRYASHRFGFDLKGADDDHVDAVRRQNRALDTIRSYPPSKRTEAEWALGSVLRERGSIHHDRWSGPAENLARQNGIKIFPRGGWWADQKGVYLETPARYSLVMSIHAPAARQDIYQAMQARIKAMQGVRNKTLDALTRSSLIKPVPIK